MQGNLSRLNVDNSPYFEVAKPQGAALLKFEWPLYRRTAAEQAESRPVEARRGVGRAAGAHRPRFARDGACLRPGRYGLLQYDAAIALQTASEAAFHSASDSYAQGVGTFTDATSAQTGLAMARAAVARAHTQSLINAAALAFATGELTSSTDFATPTPQ
ncbi:MAG: hypothetical protein WCB44_33895 [Stellaceae bacterium]